MQSVAYLSYTKTPHDKLASVTSVLSIPSQRALRLCTTSDHNTMAFKRFNITLPQHVYEWVTPQIVACTCRSRRETKKFLVQGIGCLEGEVPCMKYTAVSTPYLDSPSKQMDLEVCDELTLHRQPQTSHHRPLNQLPTTAFPTIASVDTLAVACL